MMGRTHLVTGATGGAYLFTVAHTVGVPPHLALLAGILAAPAALLPDLDTPTSTATFSLGPVTMLISWLIRGCPITRERRLLPFGCDHRGFTHRPEGWLTFGILVALATSFLSGELGAWAPLWGVAVAFGCAVHTWGDCRTTAGVVLVTGRPETRLGTTFDAGSDEEEGLRRWIYTPFAVGAWVVGIVLVG